MTSLLLNEDDIRPLLTWPTLIEAMGQALAEFSVGQADQPLRTVMSLPPVGTWFGVMPAYLPSAALAGVKLVTVCPPSPDDPHTHKAIILLVEPVSGSVVAILDGRLITEQRTAAVSALAVTRLARHLPRTLALLGSGVQARSHLEAIVATCPIEEVRVWSPSTRRNAFAETAQEQALLNVEGSRVVVRAAETAEQAVRGAETIVLVTAAATPVIDDAWVDDRALVVSVGACRPTQREMDPALVARAWLVVDSRTSALAESGDIVQGIAEGRFDASHVRAELGALVGSAAPAPPPGGPIVFKSLGLAVEDVAAAALAYQQARTRGIGTACRL